jgi:hypothetical protein
MKKKISRFPPDEFRSAEENLLKLESPSLSKQSQSNTDD